MKRRYFVSAIASVPLLQLAGRNALAATSSSNALTRPSTDTEKQAFIAIAKAKGSPIHFNAAKSTVGTMSNETPQNVHLDMNMVSASISMAAARAAAAGDKDLADKLKRLDAGGTAKQKTDFVMGTGKYYFPEDIEKQVAAAGTTCNTVCQNVCYAVCICVAAGGPRSPGSPAQITQMCHDVCRDVCHKIC